MKIKLPVILRKTHERVVFELEKDLNVQEIAREAADKRVGDLRDKLYIKEQDFDAMKEWKDSRIAKLEADLEERNKQIKGMEWCIQERDKQIKDIRTFNMKLYKKLELSSEMYRQFKDKVDKACEIDFVTRTLTPADIKKFMKVEDIVELYTLIGIAGK